jgi:hypothetical protein
MAVASNTEVKIEMNGQLHSLATLPLEKEPFVPVGYKAL